MLTADLPTAALGRCQPSRSRTARSTSRRSAARSPASSASTPVESDGAVGPSASQSRWLSLHRASTGPHISVCSALRLRTTMRLPLGWSSEDAPSGIRTRATALKGL